MRKHRKLLLALLCLVALAVVLAVARSDDEPHYQGRPLTEWLAICSAANTPQVPASLVQQAEQAVRAVGTNALPYYLQWILYKPRPWQDKLSHFLSRLPEPISDSPLQRLTYSPTRLSQSMLADWGFRTLGQQGTPAIPKLTTLLNSTNSLDASRRAANALTWMDQQGLATLVQVTANPRHPNRRLAVSSICYMALRGIDTSAAIPALIQCTHDGNANLVQGAVEALGCAKLQPEVCIPALTNALARSDQNTRFYAAHAIHNFGTNARPAIPALKTATRDPYQLVQAEALRTLREIAPELLTNAPPQ